MMEDAATAEISRAQLWQWRHHGVSLDDGRKVTGALINDEIKALGKENFFHADYEATLVDTYGTDYEDSLVVEGGETSAQ